MGSKNKMGFTQKLHKFFSIKNLKIYGMFFGFKKIKHVRKILYALPIATILLWTPRIIYAEVGGATSDVLGFLNPITWIKKLIEWMVGLGLALLSAVIAFLAMIINLIITALTWLASFFAEFALNFTLTTDYTSGGVFDAGWPVFRDLANMGLVLVIVAIALGTMLKLKIGNKDQLVPFILIAFLINFTPLIVGVVIDIANILSFVFWESAKNFVSAFIAANPLNNVLGTMANVSNNIKEAVFGEFHANDFAAIILTYSLAILLNLVILFIFLLLTALFLGRTLALLILGIISPVAFLAYILPATRKHFTTWWNNFLKWAMITIPLLISMWLGGIFINNLTGLCMETASQHFTTNIPQEGIADALSGGYGNSGASLLGNGGQNACKITSLAFAAAVLLMGVNISLKSSAAGAKIITSRAKKLRGAAAKWAKSEATKKTRQVVAKPLATTGQKMAGSRIGQTRLGAPLRNLGLAMQTPAIKWQEQYKAESKRFANMTFDQMRGSLYGRDDKGASAWAYAAKNHGGKLRKALDDPETGEDLKKAMKAMMKRANVRGDASMDDVEKIAMKEAVEVKTAGISDEGERLDAIKKELEKIVGKLGDKEVANLSSSSLQDGEIVKTLEEQGKLTKGAIEGLAKEESRLAELDTTLQETYRKEFIEELKKMSSEERIKVFGGPGKSGRLAGPEAYKEFMLRPETYKKMLSYKRTARAYPYIDTIESHPYAAAMHKTTRRETGYTSRALREIRERLDKKDEAGATT